jgi:ABC-type Fe3+ transport system substrate-binding protein
LRKNYHSPPTIDNNEKTPENAGDHVTFHFYRQFFSAFIVAVIFTCAPTNANAAQLRILTSFPPLFYTPFIEQFEILHPGTSVSILNKKTTAAIDEIMRGNDRQFDLFWSSSVDALDLLKTKQLLRHSQQIQKEPTIVLENMNINDPEGYFYGFAVSGIGWMWNSRYLKKEELPIPKRWEDLTKPEYYGHLAMSTPSRSGTTHLIVENILQKYGWEQGWAYLMKISGNFTTITARSFGVPEGIESNRFGIGLVIDFLARTKEDKNIGFLYGKPAFPVPAGIAGLNNSLNHESADEFIRFILSQEGQQILLRPEINRLPINRSLLLNQEDKVVKLLQMIDGNELQAYDINLSRQRYHLVNKLFDQLITFHLRERRHIWKRLIDLEKKIGKDNKKFHRVKTSVLHNISKIPVSNQQSLVPELNNILSSHLSGQTAYDQQRDIVATWDSFISQQFQQAQAQLDDIEQTLTPVKN